MNMQNVKKVLDHILLHITQIDNLQGITLSKVLKNCIVTKYQHYKAVKNVLKTFSVIFKRNPSDLNIEPKHCYFVDITSKQKYTVCNRNVYHLFRFISLQK